MCRIRGEMNVVGPGRRAGFSHVNAKWNPVLLLGLAQWAQNISEVGSSGHQVKPNMAAMEALSYIGFSPLRGFSCLRVT